MTVEVATEPVVERTKGRRGTRLKDPRARPNLKNHYPAKTPEAKARMVAGLRTVGDSARELANCTVIEFAENWLGVSFDERPAQRVVLKVIYGLPLDDDELVIYATLTGGLEAQREVGQEAVEAILSLGARGGKSMISAICALYEATARAHIWRQYLRGNEVGRAVVVATRLKQAEAVIQATCGQFMMDSPRPVSYTHLTLPTTPYV